MNQLIASLKRVIQGQQEIQKIRGKAVQAVGEDVEKGQPDLIAKKTSHESEISKAPIHTARRNRTQKSAAAPGRPSGKAPVDMVKVPKGLFLYGERKTRKVINHDYWIDQYPVTNEKYQSFIKAGGYKNRGYWSPEGWQWKTEEHITHPEYWDRVTKDNAHRPVVGVSYHEAEAYATWVGKRLPTELEWEKAARGMVGRKYPWGEKFHDDKCNYIKGVIASIFKGEPTPVTTYPKGVSPYGCYDMVGNVEQWCASWYDKNENERVVRGGSYLSAPEDLRASYRTGIAAVNRDSDLGFRLVQDIP